MSGYNWKLPRLMCAALEAAEVGPVFQVRPKSKIPAVKNWERAATRDPDLIARWWSWRDYNVGLATGPAGLVVIDLDQPYGGVSPPPKWAGCRDGRDVLKRLAGDAGAPWPIDTRVVITPSGGWHLYFIPPARLGLRNSQRTLGWCIDTRAGGGYVMAPGSVLAGDDRYRLVNPRPPAELPGWLAELLTKRPDPPVRRPRRVLALRGLSDYVSKKIDTWTRVVEKAVPGERANLLYRAAVALGGLVGAEMLDEREAAKVLRGAAAKHVGVEQFTEEELERQIARGIAWGRTHSRE